jgi:8-oxo-dGTP pyrophosphatase MutT (NUDIX family)
MNKVIRVVGCILQNNGKILLLFRSTTETDPSLWGLPAGKVEGNETDLQTVVREVFEETGIRLSDSSVQHLGYLPIEYDNFTVKFSIFSTTLAQQPAITLDPREHIDYRWIKPSEAVSLGGLMKDVDTIINKFCP